VVLALFENKSENLNEEKQAGESDYTCVEVIGEGWFVFHCAKIK
jgi:hypothetical protein